jgi:hypothetical protein
MSTPHPAPDGQSRTQSVWGTIVFATISHMISGLTIMIVFPWTPRFVASLLVRLQINLWNFRQGLNSDAG